MNSKEIVIKCIGILFILTAAIAVRNAFVYFTPPTMLWFCYLALFIAGIGILFGNAKLIKSQLYIVAIPNLVWSIDFISYLALGNSIFGSSDYFFVGYSPVLQIIALQHLIVIPLLIYVLFCFKYKSENSWKISIVEITLLYILTRLFTSPADNINCVYHGCGNFLNASLKIYPLLWFAGVLIMIFVSRAVFIWAHDKFVNKARVKL